MGRMIPRVPVLSLLAAAGALITGATILPTVSPASPAPLTGVYAGETSQSPTAVGEPRTDRFVLRVYRARISGVVASVGLTCPSADGPRRRRLSESYRIGEGPVVDGKGRFRVVSRGMTITGTVTKSGAHGSASATAAGCHGTGSWHGAARKL
jgi:hypothetical protein